MIDKTTSAAPTGATLGGNAAPAAPATPMGRNLAWDFTGLSAGMGFTRSGSSASMQQAYQIYKKMMEEDTSLPAGVEFAMISLDHNVQTALAISGIVFTGRVKGDKKAPVYYHVLALEKTIEPLTPMDYSFNSVRVEMVRTAQQLLDEKFRTVVETIVKNNYPDTSGIYSVDASVLPRHVNIDEKEPIMRSALNNALYALLTEIKRTSAEYIPLILQNASKNASLAVRITYNKEVGKVDYVGNPVRSDIKTVLTATAQRQNNPHEWRPAQSEQTEHKVVQIGSYIDLIWNPAQMNPYYSVAVPQPKFSPNLIMTELEAAGALTIEAQLLALLVSTSMNMPHQWMPSFLGRNPNIAPTAIDPDDVGALNIESTVIRDPSQQNTPMLTGFGVAEQYGQAINTREAAFTSQHMFQFLSLAIRPELIYSLDVSQAGADTWYNGVFAAASRGSAAAQKAILDAANTLTNGAFGRHYNSNESPVHVGENRIHAGYYIDESGQMRDLRSLGYIQVMNVLGRARGDNQVGARWQNTFADQSIPIEARMAVRKQIFSSMVPGEIVFTGSHQRVTFLSKFMDALMKGGAESGFNARTINPFINGDMYQARAIADFAQFAAVSAGNAGMYQVGGFYPQGAQSMPYGMGSSGMGGRW